MVSQEQEKILYYSLDDKITIKQLKESENIIKDPIREEKLIHWMDKYHIQGYTENSPEYPLKFKLIQNNPHLFYAIGNTEILQKKVLWIVGPRQMSSYGEQVLEELFKHLDTKEVITVSWLAQGTDQKCHKLSLKYHIPTIAILGGGLRKYLENEDRHLIQEIVNQGWCVLSEFKLNFEPTLWSFPQRNRLIAGISDYLFVPEAKEKSGSLITVDFAIKFKKQVFIAPNTLFAPNGTWSNKVLSEKKVNLLYDFSQISSLFVEKNIETPHLQSKKEYQNLTPDEQEMITFLKKYDNQDITTWIGKIDKDSGEVFSLLTMLEIKGIIYQSTPWIYAIK